MFCFTSGLLYLTAYLCSWQVSWLPSLPSCHSCWHGDGDDHDHDSVHPHTHDHEHQHVHQHLPHTLHQQSIQSWLALPDHKQMLLHDPGHGHSPEHVHVLQLQHVPDHDGGGHPGDAVEQTLLTVLLVIYIDMDMGNRNILPYFFH